MIVPDNIDNAWADHGEPRVGSMSTLLILANYRSCQYGHIIVIIRQFCQIRLVNYSRISRQIIAGLIWTKYGLINIEISGSDHSTTYCLIDIDNSLSV